MQLITVMKSTSQYVIFNNVVSKDQNRICWKDFLTLRFVSEILSESSHYRDWNTKRENWRRQWKSQKHLLIYTILTWGGLQMQTQSFFFFFFKYRTMDNHSHKNRYDCSVLLKNVFFCLKVFMDLFDRPYIGFSFTFKKKCNIHL